MADSDNTGFSVPYTVRDTPDKGRGVFVEVPVRKGTIVWRFVRGRYAVYDERSFKERLANLSPGEVVYELEHNFCTPEYPDYVIRSFDDAVLINHSNKPNIEVISASGDNEIPYNTSPQNVEDVVDALLNDRFALIAIQDMKVGDELMHDYNVGIEVPPYYNALYEQYNLSLSEPWMEQD